LNSLLKEYNKMLEIHYKAAAYLEDKSIPVQEREKHMGQYQLILKKLNELLAEIKKQGIPWTENEALNGFKIN